MQHEERLADLTVTVEVYSIASLDVLVVNQVVRCVLNVSDKGLYLELPKVADCLELLNIFTCRYNPEEYIVIFLI